MISKFFRSVSLANLTMMGICFFACICACKKNSQSPTQPPVVISSISPSVGPYSTLVTITGAGFSANAAGDSVKFNGVGAVVQQASTTQLTVVVPKAAGTGPVTVQAGSQAGSGPVFNFIYTITVSTLAGKGTAGFADGTGIAAQFNTPAGIVTDALGNIYVGDEGNHRIRKITATGFVSTFAGSGTAGFADGNGNAAKFRFPTGVAADAQGNIFVADAGNNSIRKITPAGVVSTLAGSGSFTGGFADGNGSAAQFNSPTGVATDAQGNIYVADFLNNRIRKITPAGVVSTLAGNGTIGFADGNATAAQFHFSNGVSTDSQGNVYVADNGNNRIRKISPSGVVSTLAGSGTPGFADGSSTAAQFYGPSSVTTDTYGNIYVADFANQRIRKISPNGVASTLAGSGIKGFADGSGSVALFNNPIAVASDTQGNLYVAEYGSNRIRLINVQ
jgi:sugar lactone lactonase YvrE